MTGDELAEAAANGARVVAAMKRAELRAHLDRKPPSPSLRTWHNWYTDCDDVRDAVYLGQRSARTGPDPTDAKQPCACAVCSKGRQAAKVAPGTTNGEDASI